MYYINTHYAIAIYNDNYTALDDFEFQEIQEFLNSIKGRIHFDFSEEWFTKCKVTNYYTDCVGFWIN